MACLSCEQRPSELHRFALGLMLLLGSTGQAAAQYMAGDFGSWTSGNWNTAANWRVYNGVSWATSPAASVPPNATDRAFIRTGTNIVAAVGSIYHVQDITVESGGKLWNNNTGPTSPSYVSVYGTTLRCDGQIGNGATLDGISFNIEGTNVLLSGTGQFDAARIRKNFGSNPVSGTPLLTTNLTITMNVNLRFSGGTNTMMYNNYTTSNNFNVTINSGAVVTLVGASGAGNIAVDGVDGMGTGNRGGTFTVDGTLIIPGTLYLTTDNTNTLYKCQFVINNGGYVRASQVNAPLSGTATHVLTINGGGTLEITGTPTAWLAYSTVNNTYALNNTSSVIYSGLGPQTVTAISGGYGDLTIAGSGTKSLAGTTSVKGTLSILNTNGTPDLDVTASNFQLTVGGDWNSYGQAGFTERTGRVVLNGNGTQTITTTGGEVFNLLRLSKVLATQAMLGSDVQVVDALELNTAILVLNGHELALLNGSPTAISTSSTFSVLRHIRSELVDNSARIRWDIGTSSGPHLIPFGGAGSYIPFTFDLTSGDAGQVTVATYGTPADNQPWPVTPTNVTNLNSVAGLLPDNRDATVDRFWQVDVTGNAVASVTFTYAASELPATPYNIPASMAAQRYASATDQWQPAPAGQTASAYSVIVPGLTQFGPWAVAATSSPLPVELLFFQAIDRGTRVDLVWATATEKDNDHFTILRSSDAREFEAIGSVPGAGDSQHRIDYVWPDVSPLVGTSYYRLRQMDIDGTVTDGPIAVVHRDGRNDRPMIFPNPASDRIAVLGMGDGPEEGDTYAISDARGAIVRSGDGREMVSGIEVAGLAPGTYLLRLIGRRTSAVPFVISR